MIQRYSFVFSFQQVRKKINGKLISFGSYASLEDAQKARAEIFKTLDESDFTESTTEAVLAPIIAAAKDSGEKAMLQASNAAGAGKIHQLNMKDGI